MPSFEYDLRYVLASLDELNTYLLSEELFWPVSINPQAKEPPYPKLTPGNLLFSLTRMRAHHLGGGLDNKQQTELQQAESRLDAVIIQWRTKWEEKLKWEFDSRLRQWGNYLGDLAKNPDANAPYYPKEVRLRVLLDLLAEALDKVQESALAPLDAQLRAKLKRGEFLWDEELQVGFSEERFWYLYGNLEN